MTVDLIQVINKSLTTLTAVKDLKPDDDADEYEEALETISDIVDNIDLANGKDSVTQNAGVFMFLSVQ